MAIEPGAKVTGLAAKALPDSKASTLEELVTAAAGQSMEMVNRLLALDKEWVIPL